MIAMLDMAKIIATHNRLTRTPVLSSTHLLSGSAWKPFLKVKFYPNINKADASRLNNVVILPSQVKFVFRFTFPRRRKMKVSRSRCQVHLELEWDMGLLTILQADSNTPYLLKSIHSIVINVNDNKEQVVGV